MLFIKNISCFVFIIIFVSNHFADVSALSALENLGDEKLQAALMVSKLNSYNEDKPNQKSKLLRIVYYHPSNRPPCSNYQQRIQAIMLNIQDFYKQEMIKNGLGPKTFALDMQQDKLNIHVVKGQTKDGVYGYHSGQEINAELKPVLAAQNIDMAQEKILVFNGLSKITSGTNIHFYAPYYGMGSDQKYGLCHVVDCELIDINLITDTNHFVMVRELGAPRQQSLGKFNTIYIGGTAHELGHGLTLPHNRGTAQAKSQYGTALMGGGNYTYKSELRHENKGAFITPAHAMRLVSQPEFSGSIKEIEITPNCELEKLNFAYDNDTLYLKGQIKSDIEGYAALAYNDPEGGSDYDAKSWTAYINKDHQFLLQIKDLAPGNYSLRITICHLNGATTTFPMHYSIDKEGQPDLEKLRLEWELKAVVLAYVNNQPEKTLELIAKGLKKHKNNALLCRRLKHLKQLLKNPKPFAAPNLLKGSKASLSDCAWLSAKVGYGKISRNEYSREESNDLRVFLEIGNTFYPKGLYAHAPSKFVYKTGKKWKTFATNYGLQKDGYGKVIFVIKGDGKELFRSAVLEKSCEKSIKLDISKIDKLELIVENGAENNRSCWSIWGSPTLKR